MSTRKVAVFGVSPPANPLFSDPLHSPTNTPSQASGNFGTPITTALVGAGFDVTAISRAESTSSFAPSGLRVVRTSYTVEDLTAALEGHDAAVCVVGPGGMHLQSVMIDAAEAAGVERFIVDDFGWGRNPAGFEEFGEIHKGRVKGWDYAMGRARGNGRFSWTGISTGNPVDWVSRKSLWGVRWEMGRRGEGEEGMRWGEGAG